ncbi:hypothetical protein Cni_G05475 [Canna indica]|uniref:Uncharacterized protein n=1 Tax=Canna indica TaxID=4628 RepID=A0AAQ3JUY5_9LILI|nr:hypothetical protein Cni_G05475 [Canna indica]
MSGTVSLWFIPVLFSFVWSFTLQMYLQAQSKNIIITYLAFATLALHVFLSWFLVMKLEMGLAGVMIAMIFSMWIPVLGQLAFVFFGGCPVTWTGFSFAAFTDLWAIIKLSLSSGVMLCLELWYNTILVLLTGYMKNAEVAIDALSICMENPDHGIWIGMLIGTLVQTFVLMYITWRTDWEEQVFLAKVRINRWYNEESRRLNKHSNKS